MKCRIWHASQKKGDINYKYFTKAFEQVVYQQKVMLHRKKVAGKAVHTPNGLYKWCTS